MFSNHAPNVHVAAAKGNAQTACRGATCFPKNGLYLQVLVQVEFGIPPEMRYLNKRRGSHWAQKDVFFL